MAIRRVTVLNDISGEYLPGDNVLIDDTKITQTVMRNLTTPPAAADLHTWIYFDNGKIVEVRGVNSINLFNIANAPA